MNTRRDALSRCKCPPLHTLWTASCKLSEFAPRNTQQSFCPLPFHHGCSRDVWKMLTPPESWLTCCWILVRALWSDNGHFCQTGQNSRQHHHTHHDWLDVQPLGREGRSLCSRRCSFCNWSCCWDLCLGRSPNSGRWHKLTLSGSQHHGYFHHLHNLS